MYKKDPTISEARFIAPDGLEQVVQLSGPLREGNVRYDPSLHKGHIKCLCCDADMNLRAVRRSGAGSSGVGHAEYFTVSRHQKDCSLPLRKVDSSVEKIDRTKGYRLHINTLDFNQTFIQATGAYDVSPNGRVTVSDPDLHTRESFAVNDLNELIRFMRWAKPERLNDTVVIFRNQKMDWSQFFIEMNDPAAVASLADRAKARRKGENPPFALLKLETKRSFLQSQFGESKAVPLGAFDAGVTKANRPREVNLQIYIDNRAARWGFLHEGDYLVMGIVRHGLRNDSGPVVRDWLNVKIDDGRQIQYAKFIENDPPLRRGRGSKPAPSGP